jgi:hypothetical protein
MSNVYKKFNWCASVMNFEEEELCAKPTNFTIKVTGREEECVKFLRVLWFPSPIKLTAMMTEILLKVVLNIKTLTHYK